jgi:transcriptional regulator with XRE-family HTH domain
MSLALNVRRRREALKLTQKALADAVGVSQPSIAYIENGTTRNPTMVVLRRLSETLGATIDDLLGEPEGIEANVTTEPA